MNFVPGAGDFLLHFFFQTYLNPNTSPDPNSAAVVKFLAVKDSEVIFLDEKSGYRLLTSQFTSFSAVNSVIPVVIRCSAIICITQLSLIYDSEEL